MASQRVELDYAPQPVQAGLHACTATEILFGGAAGPGKSHALRFEGLLWCLRVPGLRAFLFRRTAGELELNHVQPSLSQFPAALGVYRRVRMRWEFHNGSTLSFRGCRREADVYKYQGVEIHLLLIDELTSFTALQYDYLRSRVRCSLDIPEAYRGLLPRIVCASNPGGPGHGFAKERWVDFCGPFGEKRAPDAEGGMARCYLPGKVTDNPVLLERDPGYVKRLEALPEPYRSAYLDGDWELFMGQAFSFSRAVHVISPRPTPEYAPLYMTFDWGYGAPFSVGWWWVDADGRLYRFGEWYGWNGTPNQGLRMTDPLIAEGILKRESRLGVAGRPVARLAGPDCFSKKPDYRGGGQGPSTAEEFAAKGVFLAPGDPSRIFKIRQFHERLRVRADGLPMLLVYETCEQFIRTIPLLAADSANVEDIDTSGEDHVYDEACHALMARPLFPEAERPESNLAERLIDAVVSDGREEDFA